MNKEQKMREKLKELKSPYYKNSRRNRNQALKSFAEIVMKPEYSKDNR